MNRTVTKVELDQGYIVCDCGKFAHIVRAGVVNGLPDGYSGELCHECSLWMCEKEDGDLSHLVLGEGEILPANVGYLLSPDCVHESMILGADTKRTFLRIALPVDFEFRP
jgi:hypothetical protein